jgi:hypothetical protein
VLSRPRAGSHLDRQEAPFRVRDDKICLAFSIRSSITKSIVHEALGPRTWGFPLFGRRCPGLGCGLGHRFLRAT